MIIALALLLVLLLVIILAADIREARATVSRVGWLGFAVCVVAGAILLGRYHEPLLAGQDEAAYLHAGVTFSQNDSFFMSDEILSHVPQESRHLFRYAHEGFGWTRDNALNVVDVEAARLGPRFQPAFALLLAGAAKASGSLRGAYWVTPLFVLLAAFVIGLVARRVTRSELAFPVAMALFIFNPLVMWHGRMPRPEFAAAFLSFSAVLMVMRSASDGKRIWLLPGALAAGIAPFFHITALYLTGPFFVVATCMLLRNWKTLIGVHAVGAAAGLLFALQALWLTDHYNITAYILPLISTHFGVAVLVAAVVIDAVIVVGAYFAWWRFADKMAPRTMHVSAVALALLLPVLLVVLYLSGTPLDQREFTGYHFAHMALTDFRSVAAFLSLSLCLLSLAGTIRLLLGRGRCIVILLALSLLGLLSVGVIYDLFISRYMLPLIVPFFVIGLSAWVPERWRPVKRAWFVYIPLVFVMLLCGWHARSMLPLYKLRDYRGMTRTLKKLAKPVKNDDGILLCDYARLGAPMQRVYGIPTLTLNGDVYKDFSGHLKAWRTVMSEMPDRPAFFLTPYDMPEWDGFRFEIVEEAVLSHEKPRGGCFSPPGRRTRTSNKHFRLYRMYDCPDRSR